ncbi:MAG: tetratricopeptide repeat protein [Opitutae bacterium]|jgi:TolA-binding protein|nr:tetratricopeptide repeat protein [Opitutae bacterium]
MIKLTRTLYFLILSLSLLFFSCGGDDGIVTEDKTTPGTEEQNNPVDAPVPVEVVEEEPEPVVLPNPNGVYLPNGEEQNGKPVYANGEGFFMWFNGSTWKITDKSGGGKTISSGKESINDKWSGGGKARHFPDEEFAKDALFRLAVAYQGSTDNPNAIRLFEQFVKDFPEDKMVAEAYLSLGDLAISDVKSDEQPSFAQIQNAQASYNLVREKSQQIKLITDSTFNEGGLIERVAENPEGVVEHYLTFDKNKDEVLQSTEYSSIGLSSEKSFADFDLNDDKAIDFGELYDVASYVYYTNMEKLYAEYSEKNSEVAGARISEATEKIGLANEMLGRPSTMLNLYYNDIEKYGNDPSNVGVDGILKKYIDKYDEYEKLYGRTLDLLEKLQMPGQTISFTYRDRKGIEETITGTVEDIIGDRKKLLPLLSSSHKGMDQDIYSEVVKSRGAIFSNPMHMAKFKGYLKKYKEFKKGFPSNLSPAAAFAKLLDEAKSSGNKPLELRMLAVLDRVGSKAGGSYNPQKSDFPAASPGVLVWMAEKLLEQNSVQDAVSAMERLVNVYGDTGGEFLFDANYLLGQAKQKERDYQIAVSHYEAALANSSWHDDAHDARIRLGESLFEVGQSTKDSSLFDRAVSSFEEVRSDSDTSLDQRAQSSYMMGECKRAIRDYAGAAYYYLDTTLNFPSATKWASKSFENAIRCYEQSGQSDQITKVEKQYVAWQRKFLK